MIVMEREEVERVKQGLGTVLELVQPEPPMQDKVSEAEYKTHKKQAEKDFAEEQERNGSQEEAWKEYVFSEEDGIGVQIMPKETSGEEEIYFDKQPPPQGILPEDLETDPRWDEGGEGGRREETEGRDGQEERALRSQRWERKREWAESGRPKGTLRLLKPSNGLVAAFFVPVIVVIIMFAQRGILPFGGESFSRTNMYHRYVPFLFEFQCKLTHGGSLLYSWDIGMGMNFSALYAYYLASPVN